MYDFPLIALTDQDLNTNETPFPHVTVSLAHLSPDRVVQGCALAGVSVLCSWGRHITLMVPLSAQVYKIMITSELNAGE